MGDNDGGLAALVRLLRRQEDDCRRALLTATVSWERARAEAGRQEELLAAARSRRVAAGRAGAAPGRPRLACDLVAARCFGERLAAAERATLARRRKAAAAARAAESAVGQAREELAKAVRAREAAEKLAARRESERRRARERRAEDELSDATSARRPR